MVWLLLEPDDRLPTLARYDGKAWATLPLTGVRRAYCVAEGKPGIALVGTGRGLLEVTWASREVRPVQGPEHAIREFVTLPGGAAFAASWWALYESESSD